MKNLGNYLASALLAGSVAFAQLQPCNLAQLAGDDALFSISGGNGTFAPNSTQSILYDRPPGAPVRRIRANVTIVDLDTAESFDPTMVTGAPVEFLTNETSIQMNGVIGVTLPSDIPDSENYVFRVTLRSRGSLCYLDTTNFTVAGAVVASCTPGAFICTDDFTGFQQCTETSVNATEFAYGEPINCAATTVCSAVNSTVIQCAAPPAVDLCTLGSAQCVLPDSSEVCILDPATNTTVWSDPVPCETGFSCSNATGLCVADAVDVCTLGTSQCVLPDSSELCILDTATNTTVWSDPVPCETGFSCSNATGLCVADAVDECTLGDAECVTATSNRVCIEDTATNTTIWSDPAECLAGTTCTNGLCTSSGPGNTGCVPYSQVCLTDTTFDTCNHNENGIWSLGGVTSNCPDNTACTPYMDNANITTINCTPTNATATIMKRGLFRFKRD